MATAKKTVKKATKAAKAGSFAVMATGGKQYLVRSGDVITIEKLDGQWTVGDAVNFDSVLLTDDGSATVVGTPFIKGAKIVAELVETGRAKKIDVIKYQPKSRYYKKRGHRQPFVKVKITAIA
jgi:large subunit ribosomal protein L21